MTRREDRKKAIELRLQGKSYSEIRSELGISKSTLSGWLSKYPLSPDHLRKINNNRSKWIENYRKTMSLKREAREKVSYNEQKEFWLPLTMRELLLAGLFLYWGEGTKAGSGYTCISNTNPKIVQFALHWFINSLKVPKEKIRILVHLYSDMDIDLEIQYWKKLLNLPSINFRKPYIKPSTRAGLTYKSFGHGTCNIIISDAKLKMKIMKSIEAISDEYSQLI